MTAVGNMFINNMFSGGMAALENSVQKVIVATRSRA